ncbi:MAG: acetylornithine aminotransferase [Nitrospirae bacterium GWB2_47_37]|nr:MAG: acetylornithine aminotransferase [Nitrospirae bacterium GWA2_46_11]OGW23684.1 MAG: acetylornithine aminotransferase [Nitrospirae bacterium GWB2_47_37]
MEIKKILTKENISKDLEDADRYLMHTYSRQPVILRKGRGMKVWGTDGKEYLDFVGGIAVNVLGHCHPKVVIAIQKQAQRLLHVSNLYYIEPQIKLAKLLCAHSFADKAFFCNSGAEANEAAIKLARKYAKEHSGQEKFEIITALNSFHGRTLATVTATGQEKFQKGFEPLMPGFKYVPFNDVNALRSAISRNTCAVMLEPIQAEGGVIIPSENYLKEVRKLCDENGLLLILDEVQTGMGRTGKLFAYEHYGITPDIMTLAKGLGGGVPIGAALATERVAASFQPGSHASTFGGNPLVCAAAIATLETILEDGLLIEHCARMGKYLINRLEQLREDYHDTIADIRGKGLLVGLEINKDGAPIVKACLEKGLLINCTAGNVLRFAPPLIVEKKEIDHMVDVLEEVLGR